jgi:hypothetical protein
MSKLYLYAPSFYAHVLSSLLLLAIFIVIIRNYKSVNFNNSVNLTKSVNLTTYELLVILLLLSITTGIHSLSHLALEKAYNFNPLTL